MLLCFYETVCPEIILESYTLYRIQFARRLSQKQRRILACFYGVFTRIFCESISKIFNFSRTAEKRTTARSDNAAVSGSIADRSSFMSDCKQMQVRLKDGKYINLERIRKKYQENMLQNRLELCG